MILNGALFGKLVDIILIAAFLYLIVQEVMDYVKRQRKNKALEAAMNVWKSGEVYGGQVYTHHSGREYLIVFVTNGYCDDQHKWPLTVVYCDTQYLYFYSRPLHEFLATMKINRDVDNSIASAEDELHAMARKYLKDGKNTGIPHSGEQWYSEEHAGTPLAYRNEVTVKEIANVDRAQPIVIYIEDKYPHDIRAMNLYQFLRKFKRTQEKAE